jgi:ubiquitin-protein ligase
MSSYSARDVRLAHEHQQLLALERAAGNLLSVQMLGTNLDAPDSYRIRFCCQGIARLDANRNPVFRDEHRVVIVCGPDYPATFPLIGFETPIWHPDVGIDGTPTLRDLVWGDRQTLVDVCAALYDLIRYRTYTCGREESSVNIEAACWVREVAEPRGLVDRNLGVTLHPRPFPLVEGPSPAVVDPLLALSNYSEGRVAVEVTRRTADGTAIEYRITFRCWGVRDVDQLGSPRLQREHRAVLTINPADPDDSPRWIFQTPIWHPNVPQSGVIRLKGDRNISLLAWCETLYDLVRYAKYDLTASLHNLDAVAWVMSFAEPQGLLSRHPRKSLDDHPFPTAPQMSPDPSARLRAEWVALAQLNTRPGPIQVGVQAWQADGNPSAFSVRFNCPGVVHPGNSGQLAIRTGHRVLIEVGPGYPEQPPRIHWDMNQPIWHPNVHPSDGSVRLLTFRPVGSLVNLCRELLKLVQHQEHSLPCEVVNRAAAEWTWRLGRPNRQVPCGNVSFPDDAPVRSNAAHGPRSSHEADRARPVPPRLPAPLAPGYEVSMSPPAAPVGGRIRLLSASPPAAPANRVAIRPASHTSESEARVEMPAFLEYRLRNGSHVRVVITRPACSEMIDHARTSGHREVEVGGFLLGTVEEPSAGRFLVTVTDVLRVRSQGSSVAHVEFGTDAWT